MTDADPSQQPEPDPRALFGGSATYPESLEDVLAELSNRPRGGGRRDRLMLWTAETTSRIASRPPWSWMAEITWGVIRCDLVSGGSALAAALAYRLFVVLLPLTLVLVSGLGLYADSSHESTNQVANDYGLVGFAARSVADAARQGGTTRWYALGIGSLLVLYECYALLRALRAVHSVVWGIPVERLTRVPRRTLLFTGYALALVGLQTLPQPLRENVGLLAVLLALVPSVALATVVWIAVCRLMPGPRLSVVQLLPGAVVIACTVIVLPALLNVFLVPQLSHRSETYGALGLAAALLLALYIMGRLVLISFELTRVLVVRSEEHAVAQRLR